MTQFASYEFYFIQDITLFITQLISDSIQMFMFISIHMTII